MEVIIKKQTIEIFILNGDTNFNIKIKKLTKVSFADGNGRVGRLLYLELLKELNILNLYIPISKTLHKHSTMYYKSFEIVEKEGNYEEFIIFHLNSLCECLNDVKKNIENLDL